MEFRPNAVKAGVGLMSSMGVGLGLLLYFLIDEFTTDDDQQWMYDQFGLALGVLAMVLTLLFCPILSTIVGAIISKDFDDENDAAFNGAISGAIGTVTMVLIVSFFISSALENIDDSTSSDLDVPDTGDLLVKSFIPSSAGGALGAFVGFRYLWARMPSSETETSNLPPVGPPEF